MSKSNESVTYYRKKAKQYLAQLNGNDLMNLIDITERHKSIDLMISVLKKVQGLMQTVADKTERDKNGMFPELVTYNKHVDYLKQYTDNFSLEYLQAQQLQLPQAEQGDITLLKMKESERQLDLISNISKFEDFIEKLIVVDTLKTESKKGEDIPEHYSLVDLRLI